MEKARMESAKIQLNNDGNVFPYEDKFPSIHESVFIAPGARIIGDVTIGAHSSIWFNAVLRGDVQRITIGENTNVQDGAVLHVTGDDMPLQIGSKVTIGHLACVHACTVRDFTLIGIGATVLDGAVIEEKSMVAAGSVVRPGFVVPTGKLVAGVPAKVVRDLTPEEMNYFAISAEHYAIYAQRTQNAISKR
jgi:carbonic anhydrase/acetyltransferase-like protein (isoleucine patch superfamily)